MNPVSLPRCRIGLCVALFLAFTGIALAEEPPLREAFEHDDFVIREEMIPMRDGVGLHTLIFTPKNASGPLPVLMKRTPYDATGTLRGHASGRLEVTIGFEYLDDEYIYVVQDIRGRFRSEGDYFMYRVPRGQFNSTETDETTDAWDTIDWLVKNLPTNGRVGVWGTSYPGWLTLAAMREPHPALAAAVPFNPVVDVWKADDWFHWGAFRAPYAFDFIYSMESRLDQFTPYPYETPDLYNWMLGMGSAGKGLGNRLDERHEMWSIIVDNPGYGPYWREVAADQWFENPARLVPALHVHGFWDQEDIYGAPAVYAAIEKYDTNNDLNYFVAGPWYHGQHFHDGSSLADIKFDEDTAKRFREDVLAPFLRRHLHDDREVSDIAPATVFETGTNRWRHLDKWPPGGQTTRLQLRSGGVLALTPEEGESEPTEYVADPASPVPYAPRPNWPMDYDNPPAIAKWRRWLVEDQRFVDGRPDVATWVSEPLQEPMTIRGPVTAHLTAETTGTDADWVVKLIDVYPDDTPDFVMSGYQLMISGDIFRGRYREDLAKAQAIEAGKPLVYTIALPQANHTFLAGHRLMIQVQSSWFPLYDLNPQTFVPNIMWAEDSDYTLQTHRVHHSADHQSYVEVEVSSRD